jgi:uncharacterized protein involved in exopolysaccharide biosynthesis
MFANLPPWAAVTLLTAAGGVLSALAAGLFLLIRPLLDRKLT